MECIFIFKLFYFQCSGCIRSYGNAISNYCVSSSMSYFSKSAIFANYVNILTIDDVIVWPGNFSSYNITVSKQLPFRCDLQKYPTYYGYRVIRSIKLFSLNFTTRFSSTRQLPTLISRKVKKIAQWTRGDSESSDDLQCT